MQNPAKRLLLLALLALVVAACGPLPVTVDLTEPLRKAGLDQKQFNLSLNVPENTDLGERYQNDEPVEIYLPGNEGYTVRFTPPNLPATPVNLVLDFRARVDYAFDDCIQNLGGTIEAAGYLSPDAPPWDNPLLGLSATVELKPEGYFVLEKRISLSKAQREAILKGNATVGVRVVLRQLKGQTGSCKPQVSGTYTIERAVIEARFL